MPLLSIRALLIISILVPLSIIYAVSMFIDVRNSSELALDNVQIDLLALAGKRAAQVDIYFSSISQIPRTLAATLTADKTLDEEDFDAMLHEVLNEFPRITGLGIAFEPDDFRETKWYMYRNEPESKEIFPLDPAERAKKDYIERDWYRMPKEAGQPVWSEPYFDRGASGLPMITYSVPIFREGQFVGVVMVDSCLSSLQTLLTQTPDPNVRHYLLSATGNYVLASERWSEWAMNESIFSVAEQYQLPELAEAGRNMLQGKTGILAYDSRINQNRVWIAYAPLPVTRWTFKVAMDESHALAPVYASVYHTVLHFLVEIAVIFVVIILVASRVTVPIKRLAGFAKKLAAGNFDAQVGDIRFAKEVDQLAHTFDKMVIDLKSNIERRIKEETARKTVEGELQAARSIQASLLPRKFPPFPERKEFDMHALNEPVAFIAGDFFDFFFIEPDTKPHTLAIIIADVSGHGIPAALFMAVSRTAIRTFSTPERSPSEVIEQVNRVLSADNDDMMFVTLFYGHYNTETGDLTYVNAGHNPPYIARNEGILQPLPATGPLVAAFGDVPYQEQTVRLEPGEVLVTFTDGVTEAHPTHEFEMYGAERLERLILEVRSESVESICGRIYRAADDFAGHSCQDDVTLLVLRRNCGTATT